MLILVECGLASGHTSDMYSENTAGHKGEADESTLINISESWVHLQFLIDPICQCGYNFHQVLIAIGTSLTLGKQCRVQVVEYR